MWRFEPEGPVAAVAERTVPVNRIPSRLVIVCVAVALAVPLSGQPGPATRLALPEVAEAPTQMDGSAN